MAIKPDITPELCRQLLRYEPETGKLFWRHRPRELFDSDRIYRSWNTKWAGKMAFATACETEPGRLCLIGGIFNKSFKAHRVIWAISHGEWPEEVDHINGNPLDNRLANLRSVDRRENMRNTRVPAHNKSGRMGVYWSKRDERWLAKIKTDRGYKHIGLFSDIEDASRAFEAAKVKYGYHANHGRDG